MTKIPKFRFIGKIFFMRTQRALRPPRFCSGTSQQTPRLGRAAPLAHCCAVKIRFCSSINWFQDYPGTRMGLFLTQNRLLTDFSRTNCARAHSGHTQYNEYIIPGLWVAPAVFALVESVTVQQKALVGTTIVRGPAKRLLVCAGACWQKLRSC